MIKKVLFVFVFGLLVLSVYGAVNRKMSVVQSACVGCQDCLRVCPREAITLERGKALVDPEKCVGCRLCAQVCSFKAVKYIEKKE